MLGLLVLLGGMVTQILLLGWRDIYAQISGFMVVVYFLVFLVAYMQVYDVVLRRYILAFFLLGLLFYLVVVAREQLRTKITEGTLLLYVAGAVFVLLQPSILHILPLSWLTLLLVVMMLGVVVAFLLCASTVRVPFVVQFFLVILFSVANALIGIALLGIALAGTISLWGMFLLGFCSIALVAHIFYLSTLFPWFWASEASGTSVYSLVINKQYLSKSMLWNKHQLEHIEWMRQQYHDIDLGWWRTGGIVLLILLLFITPQLLGDWISTTLLVLAAGTWLATPRHTV